MNFVVSSPHIDCNDNTCAPFFLFCAGVLVTKVAFREFPMVGGHASSRFAAGLVLVDVEFDSKGEKDVFVMPEFCLAEVTQESFIAGGMICGKSYDDIESKLSKFGYKKLIV